MDPSENSFQIPGYIRTLIPSGEAVPEVSVVIQAIASPGVVTYYNLHALWSILISILYVVRPSGVVVTHWPLLL